MNLATTILIGFIAALHLYILWFEMFAWTTKGRAIFKGFPSELFEPTRAMAANQGLYNGFLAAGLIWTFFITDLTWKYSVALFFLCCILLAGIYGAVTVSRKIFFVQGLPALITIFLLMAQ